MGADAEGDAPQKRLNRRRGDAGRGNAGAVREARGEDNATEGAEATASPSKKSRRRRLRLPEEPTPRENRTFASKNATVSSNGRLSRMMAAREFEAVAIALKNIFGKQLPNMPKEEDCGR